MTNPLMKAADCDDQQSQLLKLARRMLTLEENNTLSSILNAYRKPTKMAKFTTKS